MTLAAGSKLGPYEILAPIGAGGMGEVYRARDTRLGREVAIKVSVERFNERFEREARAVAALNHPNICTLYDVGPNYLVMELVEGESPKGPLALPDALRIARQIGDALEAAHEKGIVHRDLKPDNIKIKPDGTVKVLDFGLAKMALASAEESSENSPTLTLAATQAGIILGTAGYMAPEQARGKVVDKRADIWAFGVVLYELLTGERLFRGEDLTETLAAIVKEQPELSRAPREVQRLLASCLEKDPKQRLRDIGDAWRLVESPSAPQAAGRRRPVAWTMAAAALVLAATVSMYAFRGRWGAASAAPDLTLSIVPPNAIGLEAVGGFSAPMISPDGSAVLYFDRSFRLYLRRLNGLASLPLSSVAASSTVDWSADSKSIVFSVADNVLYKMRVPDGAPEMITPIAGPLEGAAWRDDGTILFSAVKSKAGLYLVSSSGGEAKPVVAPGLPNGSYFFPEFVPGTDSILFSFLPDQEEQLTVYLARLRDGRLSDLAPLMKNDTAAHYTPAAGGRALFVRNDNLYSQKLDVGKHRLGGDPELLAQSVASSPTFMFGNFSVSRRGVIAWRPGRAWTSQVTVYDRQGKVTATAGTPSAIISAKLSPDEHRMLVSTFTGQWLVEPNGSGNLRVRRGPSGMTMLWSTDGSHFLIPDAGRILERPVNEAEGSKEHEREVARVPGLDRLEDVSPDGKTILFTSGALSAAVYSVRLEGPAAERAPRPAVQTGERAFHTRFSPDGRWILYELDPEQANSGGIYVQPFPGPGLRKQIAHGGLYPVWRKDGKEILYLDSEGAQDRLWSIRVEAAGTDLRFGPPEKLFPVGQLEGGLSDINQLAVSRDGSRIFYPRAAEQPDSNVIHVRIGWSQP